MAPVNTEDENAGSKCTWCQQPAFVDQASRHARKCTGCLPTKLYCVSCNTENCSATVCTAADHPTCWKKHVGGSPEHERETHQIADPFPTLFVEAVTHSEKEESTLRTLHEKDKSARWFSVNVEKDGPHLWRYDRFIRLCDPSRTGNRDTENHYPTFVSFIGNTSVGKSTIVRAMLLLGLLESSADSTSQARAQNLDLVKQAKKGKLYMPVPRSGNTEHMTDPTTFGVHLYPDEGPAVEMKENGQIPSSLQAKTTEAAQYPLLFADCEGFGAGTATTNAIRLTEAIEDEEDGIVRLPIEAPCYNNGNRNGIDLFYAKVLYAISDVIVFVTKCDQTIKVDLIRVLEWASTAVRKSYNQPSRKTLIIVQNMERQSSQSGSYSNKILERSYLQNFGDQKLWADSDILKSFVEEYNCSVRPELMIGDNEQLYNALFQNIKCCYIPDKGLDVTPERAQAVYDHFKDLRNQIKDAAAEEQQLKAWEFAQYNVSTLNHILGQVFEHFRCSEDPLNFYLAARRDNPTPRNNSQHVANFLRLALEHTDENSSGIKDMIVDAASLMFLICVQRDFPTLSNPSQMFDDDLKKFWIEGVEMYLTKHEKCTYYFTSRDDREAVRCTVTGRYEHKMHVYSPDPGAKGSPKSLVAPGNFIHRRSWSQADKDAWLQEIHRRFRERFLLVFSSRSESPSRDPQPLRDLRQSVHREHRSVWNRLQSNKTCLSCCQAVPDHVLPCGHSYCPRCVQELGKPSRSFESAFDIMACILCGDTAHSSPHKIQLKPKCAGARILTLDGGGIRGIVELALLRALEKEIGLGVSISEMFDLVVGTSTGGIIALGLVMSPESIDSIITFFKKAASATFAHSRSGITTGGWMFFGRYRSKYAPTPLESQLCTFFREETSLFAPAKSRHFQSTTRVAVTTARDEGATECLIANYNRPLGNWTRFEREDDVAKDMKIWEAGMATSAAPIYLPPFIKRPGNADYVDGAVYANCPAKVAKEEMDKLWPNEGTSLDILLSLGTGHQSKKKPKILKAIRYGFFLPIFHMFERQLDNERTWDDLVSNSSAIVKARLHRLNPDIQGQSGGYVDIDHYKELQHLFGSAHTWTEGSGAAHIRSISRMLIANLFFFEPEPENLPQEGETFCGSVRCRLQHESEALRALLEDKVTGFWHATVTKSEVPELGRLANNRWRLIKDNSRNRPAQMIVQDGSTKKFQLKFQLQPSIPGAPSGPLYQVLAVQLVGESEKIAISGFPALLVELNDRSKAKWLQ